MKIPPVLLFLLFPFSFSYGQCNLANNLALNAPAYDGVTWTTLQAVTGNQSFINNLGVSATAQYVRMYGLTRGTAYGYALNEFQVLGPVTLPVDFEYFSAAYVNNSYVSLQWAMASQTATDHFNVERSTDDINYTLLQTITAAGAPGVSQQYQTRDNNPVMGSDYYRITAVDNAGNPVYSQVDVVDAGKSTLSLSAYPNPITDYVQVSTNPASGEVIQKVSLYSLTGALLMEAANAGLGSSVKLPCQRLSQGMYVLTVTTNLQTKIFKLVK
jgi:Secretion system C-terminal sorting domain